MSYLSITTTLGNLSGQMNSKLGEYRVSTIINDDIIDIVIFSQRNGQKKQVEIDNFMLEFDITGELPKLRKESKLIYAEVQRRLKELIGEMS